MAHERCCGVQGDLLSDFRREQLAAPPLWKLRDFHRLFDPPLPRPSRPGRRPPAARTLPVPSSYLYSPALVARPRDWPDHVQVLAPCIMAGCSSLLSLNGQCVSLLPLHSTTLGVTVSSLHVLARWQQFHSCGSIWLSNPFRDLNVISNTYCLPEQSRACVILCIRSVRHKSSIRAWYIALVLQLRRILRCT